MLMLLISVVAMVGFSLLGVAFTVLLDPERPERLAARRQARRFGNRQFGTAA